MPSAAGLCHNVCKHTFPAGIRLWNLSECIVTSLTQYTTKINARLYDFLMLVCNKFTRTLPMVFIRTGYINFHPLSVALATKLITVVRKK